MKKYNVIFSYSNKKIVENFDIHYMDVGDFVNTNWED